MATQMFEGTQHAAVYLKYRFAPGKELKDIILAYLQEKVSGAQLCCVYILTPLLGVGSRSLHPAVSRAGSWDAAAEMCPMSLQAPSCTQLAVDVGCGSGQGTAFLADRFAKVVGTDISQAQIQEAKAAPSPPNISYL